MLKQSLVKDDGEVFKQGQEKLLEESSLKIERHNCLGSCGSFTMHRVIKKFKKSSKVTLICTICGYSYDLVPEN